MLDRYILGPALGRGATSVVHRAVDRETGEEVAVKVVPAELGLGDRVQAEARAAARLDHPCVVGLRDWGQDDECLYLVWDLVDGPSLAQALRGPDRPGPSEIVRIGEDVLAGLAHAHARGVVHRDVKPANILLDGDGRARLSDFGVARLSGEAGLTLPGDVVGTVAYMSPEQARGEVAGPASDVYSACLVVFEGLVGRNPISAESPAETARRAGRGGLPPLAQARPGLPERLCEAVDAGLRRDPRSRPTAAELHDELRDMRGGLGAVGRRGVRALPAAASAAGGAALAALALARTEGGDAWHGPAGAAAVIAAAAAAFAWRPRAAALGAVAAGSLLVAPSAPAAAAILGLVALAVVVTGWPTGRLTLLPAAAPALFAIGLGPLYCVAAGVAPRWPARLWAAAGGAVAALAWPIAVGGGGLLAESGAVRSALGELRDERSPYVAGERLWQPLADRPEALMQAAVLVAAAMCVPLVMRAPQGTPRTVAACAAALLAGGLLVALSSDPVEAVGTCAPAVLVVVGAALRPWRALRRGGPARTSATLRSPSA
ncbi:MAG: serine/threonine-protein kinase [Thermoleophilia bacterium]